jgi:hypothetical protein
MILLTTLAQHLAAAVLDLRLQRARFALMHAPEPPASH